MATKEIPLTRGFVTIVDEADYDWLMKWKWLLSITRTDIYHVKRAVWNKGDTYWIYMHRLIMDAPKDMQVDHINGNGLDNRRCNLRLATKAQNQQNRKSAKGSTSKYLGVSWNTKRCKWVAFINNKKPQYLGTFKTEQEAALAYNEAASMHFGEFARLNKIHDNRASPPNEPTFS